MMALNYDSILYRANHALLGDENAVLTVGVTPTTLTAVDKTTGIEVGDSRDMQVQTIKPAAVLRAADFFAKGLSRSDLNGSILTLNGKDWQIESHMMQASPGGEADGEIMLLLIEAP
jgi:hypothetical protein